MNKKPVPTIFQPIAIFTGLAVIFAVLLFAAGSLQDTFAQMILASLGSALFGSGLTYFLIRVTGTGKAT